MTSKKRKIVIENEYTADTIKTVDGTDAIRKFPGMYIGAIGQDGVFHIFREVIDNSLDESKAGFCDEIFVDINEKTGKIIVSDKGRGIPVEKVVELCTKLHSSGKYEGQNYKESIGLHGIGLKACNALSDEMVVIISRDGKKHRFAFSKGEQIGKEKIIGESSETGTYVCFHPDAEVLEDIDLDYKRYYEYCETISFLYPNLNIVFHATTKDGNEISKEFLSKNGIVDYVRYLDNKLLTQPISLELHEEKLGVDVALAYRTGTEETVLSYCNGVKTTEGGTHEAGFRQGLTTTLIKYIKENNMLTKKDEKLEIIGDDTRAGLVCVIVARHHKPQLGGQAKNKLLNTDVRGICGKVINDKFMEYLKSNPNEAKKICNKVIAAAKGRIKSKQIQEVESKKTEGFTSLTSLSKFVPCSSKDPSECELFIVEGDSEQRAVGKHF